MKLHGNGAIFLLIFSEAKLSRIPATLPTPCDIIGQKAAFFDFLCADRKSAMSKKSSKIKGFRVRKKYFCEYLTHSDDLGRIVIPKEIRRTLRIREGDPLEIFTDREGKVILKKYSPIGELGTLAGIYADSLSKTLDCTVCITDTDQVIAAAGNGKKELQEMLLSAELAEVFQERKTVLKKSSDAEFVAITKDRSEYSEEIISVILSEGDIAGGVIFLQKNEKKHFGEMEKKFAAGAADLLGRQLS